MILDLQTKFSDAQAITATAISTNIVDTRVGLSPVALVDQGRSSGGLVFCVNIITAAAGGDAAKTLIISLESDSTPDLATSPTVHFSSGLILGSALTAGKFVVKTGLPGGDWERYLGVRYTVSAGFTAFTLNAFLTPSVDANKNYPINYTVI